MFAGYDVSPVADIVSKIKAVHAVLQPFGSDPMLNFTERDLVSYAEAAGFREVYLELRIEVKIEVKPERMTLDWETFIRIVPNPKLQSLEETIRPVLTVAEREAFIRHMRPLLDTHQPMRKKTAAAFLWATK